MLQNDAQVYIGDQRDGNWVLDVSLLSQISIAAC